MIFLPMRIKYFFACDPDLPSVMIWVQTVCIGYQQTTKVAANTYMRRLGSKFECFPFNMSNDLIWIQIVI